MKEKFEELYKKIRIYLKEKDFIISDNNLRGILGAIQKKYPLLIVGPTGSGKTKLLMLLSEYFKGSYEYASLNGSVTIHDLTQERILDKKGQFVEKDMILAQWLRKSETGLSILHLDEVNAARPETLLALHPIMDIKGELYLPYSNERLKVNDNSILVMSANEGDEYIGINAMNSAFQNRYIKIHLPYITGESLIQLLTKKTDVPYEQATKVVNTWEKYMSSKEPEQPIISIRLLERWCELSKLIGLKNAGEVTFANLIARDEDEKNIIINGDFFINLETK